MRLSTIINKFSWQIKAFKYKKLKGINSIRDFYRIIEWERERANRNNHKISLVVFNLESFPDDSKERKQLIRNIINEKRKIDNLGWYEKQSIGVLLPYTSSNGARQFSVRVSRTLNFIMPDSFCFIFTYPLEDKIDDKYDDDIDAKDQSKAEENEHSTDNAEGVVYNEENKFDDCVQNMPVRNVTK